MLVLEDLLTVAGVGTILERLHREERDFVKGIHESVETGTICAVFCSGRGYFGG